MEKGRWSIIIPLLANTVLFQMVIALVRITISYRAVELHLSIVWLGVIAGAFAIFPIFLAVWVGRFIDRGKDATTALIGAGMLVIACAGFVLFSSSVTLLVFTALLGVGQLFMMAAHQMLCVRAGGSSRVDQVFGNYMVATAVGQGLGPFLVAQLSGHAILPPTERLFTLGLAVSMVTVLIAMTIKPSSEHSPDSTERAVMPLKSLLGLPGLNAVIAAGIFIMTAQDLVLIYFPTLGAERTINVNVIGSLLTVRAIFSIVSRLIYSRMVTAIGRDRLMVLSTFIAASAFAVLAAPIPLWAMYLAMAVMGFTLGMATTLSIVTVVDRTPANARGTANSLRIMGNRLGQVSLPLGAGLVAASTGVAGIMLLIAVSLAASAAAVHLTRPIGKHSLNQCL